MGIDKTQIRGGQKTYGNSKTKSLSALTTARILPQRNMSTVGPPFLLFLSRMWRGKAG